MLYKDEKLRIGLEEMIYAFDSSTIELCLKLCPWAEFHHGKGAFKIHTLMNLRGSIPTFVMLTPGKVNDARMMDKIPVEAGAFYLMDRGYVAFEKLYKHFQQKGAYFVTRAKDNMSFLLIIAKKRYGLDPSLHSISNSIGQVLFQRADIREIYNQPTTPVSVPEAGSVEQPTLW